jgi:hypothetical protein
MFCLSQYIILLNSFCFLLSRQVQLQMFVCVYTSKDFGCFCIDFHETFVNEHIIPKSKLYVVQVVFPEILSKYWSETRYKIAPMDENEIVNIQVQESTMDNNGKEISSIQVTCSQMSHCNGLVKIPDDNNVVSYIALMKTVVLTCIISFV